jgi:hypothetical protein
MHHPSPGQYIPQAFALLLSLLVGTGTIVDQSLVIFVFSSSFSHEEVSYFLLFCSFALLLTFIQTDKKNTAATVNAVLFSGVNERVYTDSCNFKRSCTMVAKPYIDIFHCSNHKSSGLTNQTAEGEVQ